MSTDGQKLMDEEHDKIWKQTNTCAHTKRIIGTTDKIPTKSLLKLDRNRLRQVLQVLTGHGNLAKHRHRMGKVQSPICPKCQEAVDTPQHYVGECPAYIMTRISQFGYYKIELADLVKNDRIFKLANFVQKTKRLEEYQ